MTESLSNALAFLIISFGVMAIIVFILAAVCFFSVFMGIKKDKEKERRLKA